MARRPAPRTKTPSRRSRKPPAAAITGEFRAEERAIVQVLVKACSPRGKRWSLQDAKAKFSEVVKRVLDGEPQCVSRQGKDAVIIVSYDAIMKAVNPPQNLFDFFRSSPLVGADLNMERMKGDFRKVDL